jgi:hypothetical protein
MPTVKITSENQLQAELEKIITKVIENVSLRVTLALTTRINRDVYTTQNDWYLNGGKRPSFEFRDVAWKWKNVQKNVNELTKEMFYDWQAMSTDPEGWKHYSNVKGPYQGDSRPYLAAILNELHDDPYTSSMMWGPDRHFSHARRKYWDNFLEDLFDNKKLEGYFIREFRIYGIRKV